MIDYNREFKIDKILIRPMKLEDFDQMFHLTSDPEMWKFFTSDLSKSETLKNWVTSAVNDNSRLVMTCVDSIHKL